MNMTLLLPIICLFACVLTLIFEAQDQTKLTIKAKLLASLSFVGFAWTLDAWQSHYGQMIFVGLLLSLIGDVLLALKGKKLYFIFGIAAFLLAHVFYTLAFAMTGFDTAKLPMILPLIVLFLSATALWLRRYLNGVFIIAVPAYLLAIGVMLVFAWGNQAGVAWPWIVSGASLFAFSDLLVARNRFIKPDIRNRIIGLPIYYLAQLLLAYGLAFVV